MNMNSSYKDELKTLRKNRRGRYTDLKKLMSAEEKKINAAHVTISKACGNTKRAVAAIDRRIAILEGRLK